MSRKRSKYRPRPVLADPVGYVLEGLAPVAPNAIDLRIRYQSALESLGRGTAEGPDVGALIDAANMTTAFARLGSGRDYAPEIRAGVDAVEAVRDRRIKWGKVQATPTELAAIETMIDVHDAQIRAAAVVDMEAAIKRARRMVATVGV